MTTGRIDYSPDYKLITEVVFRCPNCGNPDCAEAEEFRAKIVKETTARARLERAVVEAAALRRRDQHAMFQQGTQSACDVFTAADSHFESSLTALLEFEAKQAKRD